MKRNITICLLALAALLGLSACQKDSSLQSEGVEVSVSVALPELLTKAVGDGSLVNRCVLEVYENGLLYGTPRYATVENLSARFSLRLIAGRSYEFVFWADVAGASYADMYYDTSAGLTGVKLLAPADYLNNVDAYDAFSGSFPVTVSQSTDLSFTLTRPLGQISLYTLDLADIPATVDLTAVRAKVSFSKVPTTYNALTKTLSAATADLAPASVVVPVNFPKAATDTPAAEAQISFDYLFASALDDDRTLVDFTLELVDAAGAEVSAPFSASNVPMQANYQTLVKANFLTKGVDVVIELEPVFDDPEIGQTITERPATGS